ncbi:hypothetical protein T484DRAFT_2685037 [Baffinella frigidus]|jgi:hypothetical protein|nr:hypothetical protein T484DRAFT_2685037 [Cryptophyta sp. CCMP2293]
MIRTREHLYREISRLSTSNKSDTLLHTAPLRASANCERSAPPVATHGRLDSLCSVCISRRFPLHLHNAAPRNRLRWGRHPTRCSEWIVPPTCESNRTGVLPLRAARPPKSCPPMQPPEHTHIPPRTQNPRPNHAHSGWAGASMYLRALGLRGKAPPADEPAQPFVLLFPEKGLGAACTQLRLQPPTQHPRRAWPPESTQGGAVG